VPQRQPDRPRNLSPAPVEVREIFFMPAPGARDRLRRIYLPPLLDISTYVELFMARDRSLSLHAWTLLEFLAEMSGEWGYGYEIIRFSGLQSGTLYPLLIRLEAKGLLQAKWQPPISPGRPPRHAYRLTAAGRALVRNNKAAQRRSPRRLDPVPV
jgi:DNA-binding MarR family transcriptional regulator